MADKRDLKGKCPLEEDHDSSYQEGYKKARMETQDHYRVMLIMMKEQIHTIDVYHNAKLDVNSLTAKLNFEIGSRFGSPSN